MSSQEAFARRQGLNLRDALIFVVDFRVGMLHPDSLIAIDEDLCPSTGTPSLLSITLRCIADVLKSKIISRASDAVAVIAFGTRGQHARRSWPGVRVLRALAQPDAASVKQLQHIAQRVENGEADPLLALDGPELREKDVPEGDADFCFGPDGPVEFDKVLWAARHQFTAMTASRMNVLHRKRVFLFTNDDDPSRGNNAVRQLSLTQAKDLADMGATLDVSLLTSPSLMTDTAQSEAGPDSSQFFNDLVYTDESPDGEDKGSVMIATIYSFDDLLTRVRKKQMTKRAIRKTTLVLGNDYKIGVAIYAMIRKASRPVKVELAASTNKPVYKITTNTCENSGEILKQEAVRTTFIPDYLKDARHKVPGLKKSTPESSETASVPKAAKPLFGFKKSELPKAKGLGQMGIVMYGFRKLRVLRKEYILGTPSFVFPDDSLYSGSTRAFTCLLKCMLQREVVGIASVRLREGSGMRFAALVPQQEDFSLEPVVPGGFHLFYLPYKDDVYTAWRKEMKKEEKKEEEEVVVKEEDVECNELNNEPAGVSVARRMVRNMTIGEYSPHLFLNPDLQRFYAGLENAAGVESRYNPQDDLLNPDVETLQKRAGHLATELKRLEVGVDFDGEALAEQFGTKTSKRAADQSGAAVRRQAEKQKAREEAAKECDTERYIAEFHDGTLEKLLKADLQIYCRAHGLLEKGTKKNLLIVIEDHIRDTLAQKGDSRT